MDAPSPCLGAALLCCPSFYPNHGSHDTARHNTAIDESYFAITGRGDKYTGSVVSSSGMLHKILRVFPKATYFEAETYLRVIDLWNQNCAEYHNHEGVEPATASPSSPSDLPKLPLPTLTPSLSTQSQAITPTSLIEPVPTRVIRHFLPHNFHTAAHKHPCQVAVFVALDPLPQLVWISDDEGDDETSPGSMYQGVPLA
ncbi:hypothetical protein B0H10DRAFT_1941161 [Mycena sp. CBHHK59/15]|nr:hypothetical protein B0H10DRAFT_1941161 [Mycena sp. CBHHK59/15]